MGWSEQYWEDVQSELVQPLDELQPPPEPAAGLQRRPGPEPAAQLQPAGLESEHVDESPRQAATLTCTAATPRTPVDGRAPEPTVGA